MAAKPAIQTAERVHQIDLPDQYRQQLEPDLNDDLRLVILPAKILRRAQDDKG